MKKLLSAGMPGCRTVRFPASPLLLFLLLPVLLRAQIPINGFCRYDSIGITKGYSLSFPLNYNGDEYTDLLCFKPGTQQAVLLKGKTGAEFDKESVLNLPVSVDRITLLSDISLNPEGYAVVSKKKKSVSFMKLSSAGISVYKELNFTSIPNAVVSADIDVDSDKELMISGPAFNGLAIVDKKGNKTKEQIITPAESFSGAVFADLNNDSYPDIAAYSPVSARLRFYYNNSRGNFSEVRSFPLKEDVLSVLSGDLNGDLYTDVLVSTPYTLYIWYGDGINSFEHTQIIHLTRGNKKTIQSDLNADGKADIAVLSPDGKVVSVYFQKDDGSFSSPWDLRPGKSIADISVYNSNFVRGITAISQDGVIYLLSNYTPGTGTSKFIFPFYPAVISSFDFTGNGADDIIMLDTVNYKINVIFRNNNGIPVLVSSMDIFEKSTGLTPIVSRDKKYAFYIWKPGGRSLLEIVVDPIQYTLKQKVYYLNTSLRYVTAFNTPDGSVRFSIIAGEGNALKSDGLKLNGDFLQLVYSVPVTNMVGNPAADGTGKLYYVQNINDTLQLLRTEPDAGQTSIVDKRKAGSMYSLLFAGDVLNNDNRCAVVLTEDRGNAYFSLFSQKYKRKFRIEGELPESGTAAASFLLYTEANGNLNRFFMMAEGSRLYSLLPLQRKKTMYILPYESFESNNRGVTLIKGDGRKPFALLQSENSTVLHYTKVEAVKGARLPRGGKGK